MAQEPRPAADRLRIVESTVHQLREDLERFETPGLQERDARLARAAEALLADYSNDKELTAFTVLDAEEFRAR